jgi:hypothetical protein
MVAAVSDAGGSKGRVSTISGGTAIITVQYMGATGTATVRVTAATLRSITVAPGFAIIPVAAFQNFTATGTFSDD